MTEKEKLILQKLRIESQIRMVMKIQKVMGLFDEKRLDRLLKEFSEIEKKIKNLD